MKILFVKQIYLQFLTLSKIKNFYCDNFQFECGLIAAGLLFFFLSALTWMLLEGYQLYQMLVEVFPTGSRKFIYFFIGYTFPAAVTGFAYYFYPQGFGTRDYCW